MITNESITISDELKQVLRRLRLSPMLDTLPERLVLARQRKMPHQDFMLTVLSDEVNRRENAALGTRVTRAKLNPKMRLENWDDSAKVTFDKELWAELCTLRFIEARYNVLLLGPVGVGKTFLGNSLGHIACRRGYSTLFIRAELLFKQLKGARLDQTYEREMRRFLALDLIIIDDFGLDQMDALESRDFYDLIIERQQKGSMIVSSNRDPNEWLALMADPIRAQSAVDRLQNSAYELVIEGESYRKRQKPKLPKTEKDQE